MASELIDFDESQLLLAACNGKTEALGLLLFRLKSQILGWVRGQIGGKLKAVVGEEDVLQEVYRRAFAAFASAEFGGEPAMDRFVGWLRVITKNCLREMGRGQAAEKRGGEFRNQAASLLTELSTGDATVSQFAARAEAGEALRIALAALPSDQQTAVRLRYFDQLSIDAVAAKMERSAGSVRGLLDRARSSLRVAMHTSALWLSRRD